MSWALGKWCGTIGGISAALGVVGIRPLRGRPRFSRRCQIAKVVLEAQGREIAADVEMRGAKCFRLDDAEPGRLEKSRALDLIETPERLQRSRRAVIDPYAIVAKDAVDFIRQPARVGDQIEQECGDDAIHRTVGEGGIERHPSRPARHPRRPIRCHSPAELTWPAWSMARGKARSRLFPSSRSRAALSAGSVRSNPRTCPNSGANRASNPPAPQPGKTADFSGNIGKSMPAARRQFCPSCRPVRSCLSNPAAGRARALRASIPRHARPVIVGESPACAETAGPSRRNKCVGPGDLGIDDVAVPVDRYPRQACFGL